MKTKSLILLFLIIQLAMFLRLYKISDTITHSTDQTAAYLIVDRMINDKKILLVGPLTSIWQANLLPPTYYYIIAGLYSVSTNELFIPFVFSLLNTLTTILIFLTGTLVFRTRAGLISAFLFAVSEVMVWYGRDFWEPYLVPFFVALSILFIFVADKKRNPYFLHSSLIVFFLSFLYVSSVLILPVYFYIFMITAGKIYSSKKKTVLLVLLEFILIILLFYFPVILYEFRNNFPSIRFILGSSGTFSFFSLIPNLGKHLELFFKSLLIYVNTVQSLIFAFVFMIIIVYFRSKTKNYFFKLLTLMFISGFLLTSIYSGIAQVYRLAAIYPVFYLILGFIIAKTLSDNSKSINSIRLIIFLFFAPFIFLNIRSLLYWVNVLKMTNYLHPYRVANEIIRQKESDNFTLYTIDPLDIFNHQSTAYWYALEKITGKRYAALNQAGNWISQNLDENKKEIYLICKDFENVEAAKIHCLKNFAYEHSLIQPERYKTIDSIFLFKLIKT